VSDINLDRLRARLQNHGSWDAPFPDAQYKRDFEAGVAWEEVVDAFFLSHWGIDIGRYTSPEDQFTKGESRVGLEIKLDRKWEPGGNFYIELLQRSSVAFDFSDGSVLKSRYLCIGNPEHGFYVFDTGVLLATLKEDERKRTRTNFNQCSEARLLYPHEQERIKMVSVRFAHPVVDGHNDRRPEISFGDSVRSIEHLYTLVCETPS
jgi:hypothetical protein